MADNESKDRQKSNMDSRKFIDRISANRYWKFFGGFSGLIAILMLIFSFIGPQSILNYIFPKDELAVELLEINSTPDVFLLPDHVEEGSTVYVSSNASLAESSQLTILLSAINQSFNQIRIREDNVFIQVINYEPIDRNVNIWHYHPELGGGPDWKFGVNLDPDSLGMVRAEYRGSGDIDSIFINPKEEEHIRILFSFSEPGIYTFQIVIKFFHQGKPNEVSLEKILTITVPADFTKWNGKVNWETRDSISDLEIDGYCNYIGDSENEWKWMSNYECSDDN